MKRNIAIFVFSLLCVSLRSAGAQETASFMRNPSGTASMSLAGAGIVSMDDVSALDNPALTPFSNDSFTAGVSVMDWMHGLNGGLSSYSASARYSNPSAGTFYLGFRSLKNPPSEQTDDFGNVLQESSSPLDFSVEAGYACRFCRDFSAALTARYLRLDPGYGKAADAVSFDLSLGYRHCFDAALSDVAATVQIKDFGTSPDYGYGRRSLPWLVNAGVSAGLLAGGHHRFRAGVSADLSLRPAASRGFTPSFGGEYSFRRMVYVRGGYHFGDKSAGEQRWGALGIGLRYLHVTIDAGWIIAQSASPLHNTVSCTLSVWI